MNANYYMMTPDQRRKAYTDRIAKRQATKEANAAKKPALDSTFEVLKSATKVQRAAYIARAEELFMGSLNRMRETLAEVGMDLFRVAPGGKSWTQGRKEYRMAEDLQKRYRASFADSPEIANKPYMSYSTGKTPWLVVEKPDAEAKVRAEAKRAANDTFDAFLYKMAGKINAELEQGDFAESASLVGVIWDGCTLTVSVGNKEQPRAGRDQQWTTKCILNQSVYGKLFNQWPTRRVA